VTLCGRDAVQVDPPRRQPLDLDQLARRLRAIVQGLERTSHLLRFTADGCRFSVFPGGRALLFGVQDPLRARALYDRWIGLP
jgi:adenylyltransferase/sulfurtransferase